MKYRRGKSIRAVETQAINWLPSGHRHTVHGPMESVTVNAIEAYDDNGKATKLWVTFDGSDDPQMLEALSVMLQNLAQSIRDAKKGQ